MGFPSVSAGVFPILLINTALYIAAVKNIFKSLLQTVGIGRGSQAGGLQPLPVYPAQDVGISGSAGLFSSLILPTMWDEVRQSLPQGKYDPAVHVSDDGNGEGEGTQCAVCLSKLESGADILELPRCRHIFHQSCVDEWLAHRQATCPLCRASLVSDDLSRRYWGREQELTEELVLWFSSSIHGSGLQGL